MLELTLRGKVCLLLMRHGKANALDLEFCDALAARLGELRDGPAQAVVLTGEGRIFSAGVDLPRVLDGGPDYLRVFLPALHKALVALFSFPKPVVAAINGHAIAGGCILACAADHRIAAQQAGRIGLPELLVGVPFPSGALEILRFAAAPQHVQTLLYRGGSFPPEEAALRGLVDEVVEPAALLDRALEAAEAFAALPPAAFALTKRQLREPALERIRQGETRFDPSVAELWARAESLAAIGAHVARTLKRPGGG